MEFEKPKKILKRYDFENKLDTTNYYSRKLMNFDGLIELSKLKNEILPWELEVFAHLSIITNNEYSFNRFAYENDKNFLRIMSEIRNYIPPVLEKAVGNNIFGTKLLIALGLTQFRLQENSNIKKYRYSYIFNFKNENIDMKSIFMEKFGVEYEKFWEFGVILYFIYSSNCSPEEVLDEIFKLYDMPTEHLSINRDSFINKQSEIDNNANFVFSFKLFYQYPIINTNGKKIIPLPHLITVATNDSLLYRITENNNQIREKLGKDILEDYLYHLIDIENKAEEKLREYEYIYKRNKYRTLDLLVRYSDKIVLLDSKSFVPSLRLRTLTDEAISNCVDRLVKSIIQVYKHIHERFEIYNPFSIGDISKANIFGIVVILEDSYMRREELMKKAAEKLNIKADTEEFDYLCSNITIMSLYSLENIILSGYSLLDLLIEKKNNQKQWFDLSLDTKLYNKTTTNDSKLIIERNKKISFIRSFIEHIKKSGLIS